jgi:type I restriction enzyme R subunit
MGWRYVADDLYQPAKTGSASFAEVVQEGTLRRQLYALNLRDVAGVA